MPLRVLLHLLLVLTLLVGASGAATRCVESDGTTRVELASLCCEPPPACDDGHGPEVQASDGCDGCDDLPLDARWTRPTDDGGAAHAVASPALPCELSLLDRPLLDRPPTVRPTGEPPGGGPTPRADRPARLRC